MRKRRTISVLFLICSTSLFIPFILSSSKNKQRDLEAILNKCAEYCERLTNSALFFVCREKIEEEIRSTRPSFTIFQKIKEKSIYQKILEKNIYIYDYQLIKKGQTIEENRALLEENGEKKDEKNARLKTKRFYSKRSVFGPIGLLSKEWQEKHDYKIIKEEIIQGNETIVIEARPKNSTDENPNYGKIWVSIKDFSIIKIDVEPHSLENYELYEKEAKKLGAIPEIHVSHYYEIEKNGIRFPSKTIFKEDYTIKYYTSIHKSKVIISYDNYRFFQVDVEVRY